MPTYETLVDCVQDHGHQQSVQQCPIKVKAMWVQWVCVMDHSGWSRAACLSLCQGLAAMTTVWGRAPWGPKYRSQHVPCPRPCLVLQEHRPTTARSTLGAQLQ